MILLLLNLYICIGSILILSRFLLHLVLRSSWKLSVWLALFVNLDVDLIFILLIDLLIPFLLGLLNSFLNILELALLDLVYLQQILDLLV